MGTEQGTRAGHEVPGTPAQALAALECTVPALCTQAHGGRGQKGAGKLLMLASRRQRITWNSIEDGC